MIRIEHACDFCGKPVVLYPELSWRAAPGDKTTYVSTLDAHYHADCYAMLTPHRSTKTGLLGATR